MVKQAFFLIVLVSSFFSASCTENTRAKTYGGSTSMQLPSGQKLISVTWKDANVWYLTRPMRVDEQPETYSFQESSSFGVFEGTIIIKESR